MQRTNIRQIPLLLLVLTVLAGGSIAADGQFTISSKALKEDRIISVSLPEDYESGERKYPVLYVLDGEWVFDYAVGTVKFLSNDVAGRIPKMIVVGVPNTDRARDLSVTLQKGAGYVNFLKFLETELKPLVEKRYRTNGFDVIYGWSSGGGVAGHFFASNPSVFDGYIESGSGVGRRSSKFYS
ncbi:MAG: hypothetical protein HKN33_07225, partial [Pyrinomonadaceae bacterium]|nr:hypothetical protein [Pyrinomonadaceae bacterium]